jgi:hypothetical protein
MAFREAMLQDARQAGCVGQPVSWLQERYGRPYGIRHNEKQPGKDYWLYTPGGNPRSMME